MNESDVSGCFGMPEMDRAQESYVAECSKMNQDTSNEANKFDIMGTSAMCTDHSNTDACLDESHISGIQPLEVLRFDSTQHFELQSQRMVSDSEEESMSSSPDTSSATNYDMAGCMERDLQHIYNVYCTLVDKDGPLILSPDFIMCDGTSHLEPHITFSSDGVKIEFLDLDLDKMIAMDWELSNIISISCKWAQSVGSAFITLLARSKEEIGNSGPVTLQFSLDDPQWPRKQQKICHLEARYIEIWRDIPSDDFTLEDWSIEPTLFFPRQYFLSTEDFEDVIYPKGDPDAVSLSKRDAELLLPETFVNDTIIDFYIKYLSTRIEPAEKRRYHFFNSFFFRKLADLDKDQGRAPEGRAAFLRVRKWTRKINIFDKDFLFIPVNFNLHWSLIVICYPGEVATFGDGVTKLSAKLPCILHMDSLKGSHSGLKDIIQSYLWEEWKERHPDSALDNSDKFLNLRFVSLELPQQDNSFDCGLFLLHYVELFLMNAPSNFNPLKIDVFSSFLSDDWFPPAEASHKRSVIQKLIHELVTGCFQNHPKLTFSNEQLDGRHQRNENAGEYVSQKCSIDEAELVCTVRDDTYGAQPSTSICLNVSEQNMQSASESILDAGRVSMVAVQNLQESRVREPDIETVVCLSSQDEKNDPLDTKINNQLSTRSCAPEDAVVIKGSSCGVADMEHEKSLFVSLGDNRKISCEAEVEVRDIMVSKCCSISYNDEEVIASQEHSLERSTDEVGDECYRPSQDMDSLMMLDCSKDDIGPNPAGMTGCDVNGRSEDMGSVRQGDMNKVVADVKHEYSLANPLTVENGIKDSVKEFNTTAGNISQGEQYDSSELTGGNAFNGIAVDISQLNVGNADKGVTSDNTVSSGLNEETTDQIMGGYCTNEAHTSADGDDAYKQLASGGVVPYEDATDGAVPCEDGTTCTEAKDGAVHCKGATTCTDAEVPLVDIPCHIKTETVSQNTNYVEKPLADGISEEKDIVISDEKCTQKDDSQGTNARSPLPDSICDEKDIVVCGDNCVQKDDALGIDTKMALPDGTCEEEDITVCSDKCIQKDDTHGTDAKRPLPDGVCEKEDTGLHEKNIQKDDAHGTDVKIERHYKRRKVLEKQRSSSGV